MYKTSMKHTEAKHAQEPSMHKTGTKHVGGGWSFTPTHPSPRGRGRCWSPYCRSGLITLREANAPLALVGTSRKVPSIVTWKNKQTECIYPTTHNFSKHVQNKHEAYRSQACTRTKHAQDRHKTCRRRVVVYSDSP